MNELRRKIDGSVLSALDARKALHLKMRGGGTDLTGNQKKRLPAWAKVSIPGTSAPALEMNKDGYEQRYRSNIDNRPRLANLKSVSIQRVTGRGDKLNLSLEINVEFEVYTFDAFEEYAKYYLRRDPERNLLTIEWGNGASFDGRGQVSNKIEGAVVVGGGYSNTDLNTYSCKFMAVGPAEALPEIDLLSCDLSTIFPNDEFKYGSDVIGSKEKVTSLIGKIIYDLQKGGQTRTKKYDDGEEPKSPPMNNGNPVGRVYEKFVGTGIGIAFENLTNRGEEKSGVGSDAHEYVSLEYIVDLLNRSVFKTVKDKCNNKYDYEIVFEDEGKHYTYVPYDRLGGCFRSADPTSVLFLDGKKSGLYENTKGDGKNFEEPNGYYSDCVKSDKSLNHKKILISREVIATKLIKLTEDINEAKEKNKKSEKNDTARLTDINYSIKEFFDFIFRRISTASGNFVTLSLRGPDFVEKKGADLQKLIITDMHSVNESSPEPFEFDPLKGDGSTLSLVVDGKLPTNGKLQTALLPGTGEGSGTSGLLSQDTESLSNLTQQYASLVIKLTSDDEEKGVYAKMAKKDFGEDSIADATSTLAEFKKVLNAIQIMNKAPVNGFSFTEYFDLEMKVDLEGVYPIIAGNHFTSTNLPTFARPSNKIVFLSMNIEDKIESPGVWTTSITARATPQT